MTSLSYKVFFKEHCPALGVDVIMTQETWYGHILHSKTGHPYMAAKINLIKRAIREITHKRQFFRFTGDPENSWFCDFECPDFRPISDCLRIAFKKIEDGSVIIASAYKMKRGVKSYET